MPNVAFDLTLGPDVKVPGPSPEAEASPYPRMLSLSDDVKGRLVMWLQDELSRARLELAPLVEDWKSWQTDYWAKPEQEVKNFPFTRAANIVVPLTAIAVEAVHARLMNTIHAVKPFWSIRPKNREWLEHAKPVENWLQSEAEDPNSLDVFTTTSHSLMEYVKLGTGILKTTYVREVKKSVRTAGDGTEQTYYATIRNGAVIDMVPLANFLSRLEETDPQTAPWVGEKHRFSWAQLKRMALSGRIDPEELEKVKVYVGNASVPGGNGNPSQDYREHVDGLTGAEPNWYERIEIDEIWCSFDVDGDGIDEEIVIEFHEESGTLLSARYNWYADLRRPYRVGQYVVVEKRLFGIGVCKQNEQFQKEATTIRRQRLDNATLGNMQMMVVKKSSGYGPGEKIWPGKMWFVNDVEDIRPLKMHDVYHSTFLNEQQVERDSEKRTGVNEVLLGLPQQGTPGTATGDLARIAEGNKRFDLVLRNVRRWWGLVGQDVLSCYQQWGAAGRYWLTEGPKGALVEQVLQMPQSLVRDGAIISLGVTDSIVNRQVEQQQWMSLFQIISGYYQQRITLAQMLATLQQNPMELMVTATAAGHAADEALKRLLESFNIVDPEALQIEEVKRGLLAQQTGGGGPGGPGSPAGMASPLALLALAGAAGKGRSDVGFDLS